MLIAFLAGGIVVAVRVARRSAAALVAATQAAYAGALLLEPAERPDDPVFAALFVLRAAAVTLLAIALVRTAYTAWRTRAAVARLAAELGEAPPPGTLRAALAKSLGDPGVEVVYPAGGRFIDDEGRVVREPVAGADRALTRIVRGDRCIAIVVHARGAVAQDDLARDIGAAARLAVENERLQAELLHQLDDLRASRARIVETGDAARRLLERNLHDGAQQRLLALVYDLRLARSTAAGGGRGRRSSRRSTTRCATARPRSRSCASSRTASTPRSSPRPASDPRSGGSSTRRRSRCSSPTPAPSATRPRSRPRRTSSPATRSWTRRAAPRPTRA